MQAKHGQIKCALACSYILQEVWRENHMCPVLYS